MFHNYEIDNIYDRMKKHTHSLNLAIRKLVLQGENPNKIHAGGNTYLTSSNILNDVDMVTFLLEHGADPNIPNSRGITPLAYIMNKAMTPDISEDRRIEIIRLFAIYGARE
jgi:ankyrin repeat protein